MIDLQGVTKRYGRLTALDELTLSIGEGEVFGFIGPNGAGKSTTMKILASLIRPTEGSAKLCGLDCATEGAQIRRLVGYMPDFLGVYDDLTVDEYLQFFAAAFGLARKRRRRVVDSVLELTDLVGKRDAMVDSLSRGMQQRLGVARVLIHEPKVLLLDEPASGLDPRARIEMRELLAELGRMGKTIMVSSHILSELAEMCSSIGIIEQGRLLFSGSIQDAYQKAGATDLIVVRFEPGPDGDGTAVTATHAAGWLSADDRVARAAVEADALVVELAPGQMSHHFVIESLVRGGARIASFTPRAMKLEDAFLRLTKGRVQ